MKSKKMFMHYFLRALSVLMAVSALWGCQRSRTDLAVQHRADQVEPTDLEDAGTAPDSPLFERLTAEATGIDFTRHWNPPKKYEHEIFNSLTGGGVCIGDYDGDGQADAYLKLKILRKSTAPSNLQATMSRGRFVVPVARRWVAKRRRSAVQAALAAWYRKHADVQIRSAVDRFSARLCVAVAGVEVREMKTRWGSGGTDGRLRFNWRIVMAPKRLLEYVVAHELCHIRYHDHSREFWRLLNRVMPDYEQRRSDLERLGPILDF